MNFGKKLLNCVDLETEKAVLIVFEKKEVVFSKAQTRWKKLI